MRYRTNEINTGLYLLPRFDMYFTGNGDVELGDTRQSKVSTAVSLTNAFTEANEGFRCQSQPVILKLKHHAVTFVRLDPKCICRAFHPGTLDFRTQVHDAALDWASCRVGAQCVDADAYSVGFTLHGAMFGGLYLDNLAINRADNAQRYRWDVTVRVTIQEE